MNTHLRFCFPNAFAMCIHHVNRYLEGKIITWSSWSGPMQALSSLTDPRLEARARVGVHDSQRSTVVLLVLHGYSTSVGFCVCKECRWIQTLIVHHGFTHPPRLVAAVATTERTRRIYAMGHTRPKHHGMSDAGLSRRLRRIVIVSSLTHARASTCEEPSLTKHAHVATQTAAARRCWWSSSLTLFGSLPSPPEQESCSGDSSERCQDSDHDPGNGASGHAIVSVQWLLGALIGLRCRQGRAGDGLCHDGARDGGHYHARDRFDSRFGRRFGCTRAGR